MKPEPTSTVVRARLAELAKGRGVTLTALSRMVRKPDRYIARFVNDGRPERLDDGEIGSLATFFGVEQWELGGHIGPRDR